MKAKSLLFGALTMLIFFGLFSCKKSSNVTPQKSTGIDLVATAWLTNNWGGVSGNYLRFVVDQSTAIGTITVTGTSPFGFADGDKLLTGITAKSDGTYACMCKYTYGDQNQSSGTRAAILSLQNDNGQMTVDCPALNSSFPEITYVFTKAPPNP